MGRAKSAHHFSIDVPEPTTCSVVADLLFKESGNPRRVGCGAEFALLFLNVLTGPTLKLALKKKQKGQEVNAVHVFYMLKDPMLGSALADLISTLMYESVPVGILPSKEH